MNKKVQNFFGIGLFLGGFMFSSTVFAASAGYQKPDVDGPRAAVKVDNDNDGYCYDKEMGCFDCNDADPTIHPGATETCNFKDDDCDGVVDTAACFMIRK